MTTTAILKESEGGKRIVLIANLPQKFLGKMVSIKLICRFGNKTVKEEFSLFEQQNLQLNSDFFVIEISQPPFSMVGYKGVSIQWDFMVIITPEDLSGMFSALELPVQLPILKSNKDADYGDYEELYTNFIEDKFKSGLNVWTHLIIALISFLIVAVPLYIRQPYKEINFHKGLFVFFMFALCVYAVLFLLVRNFLLSRSAKFFLINQNPTLQRISKNKIYKLSDFISAQAKAEVKGIKVIIAIYNKASFTYYDKRKKGDWGNKMATDNDIFNLKNLGSWTVDVLQPGESLEGRVKADLDLYTPYTTLFPSFQISEKAFVQRVIRVFVKPETHADKGFNFYDLEIEE